MMVRAASLAIWLALAGVALLCIATLNHEHQRPNAGLPLVQADYEQCITVPTPPLVPPKTDVFHPQAAVALT
jgi:hypothetical protein